MISRLLFRWVAKIPGVPGNIAEWYDEMRVIADMAAAQRLEDEAGERRPTQDMARWITEPTWRRPAPRRGRHDDQ